MDGHRMQDMEGKKIKSLLINMSLLIIIDAPLNLLQLGCLQTHRLLNRPLKMMHRLLMKRVSSTIIILILYRLIQNKKGKRNDKPDTTIY